LYLIVLINTSVHVSDLAESMSKLSSYVV